MLMKPRFIFLIVFLAFTGQRAFPQQTASSVGQPAIKGVRVGVFEEEVSNAYTVKQGIPSDDVRAMAITASGDVYAATGKGLARFSAGKWTTVAAEGAAVGQVAAGVEGVWFVSAGKLTKLGGASFPLPPVKVNQITSGGKLCLATDRGLYILDGKNLVLDPSLERMLGSEKDVRQVAVAADGRIAVAAMAGLFLKQAGGAWSAVYPRNATRSWAPYDVWGVAFDSHDRLWFSSVQGVGCKDKEWHLYTGADGLPYNDFTTLEAGENGAVWFGTGWERSASTAETGNIARGGAGCPRTKCARSP